jgi:hypothetical protein
MFEAQFDKAFSNEDITYPAIQLFDTCCIIKEYVIYTKMEGPIWNQSNNKLLLNFITQYNN